MRFGNGERIECTKEHPFYVQGKGFVPAGEIGIGTSIVTRAGPTTKLQSVEHKSQRVTVYNFEVEGFHSYFVGHSALWVHNTCGDIALGKDPYFKMLASQTGAAPYRQWALRAITRRTVERHFGRALHQAAQRAENIHFTLDGIANPTEAIRLGAQGFRSGNMTNAELHYVVNNPDILGKTLFYRGGNLVPFAP